MHRNNCKRILAAIAAVSIAITGCGAAKNTAEQNVSNENNIDNSSNVTTETTVTGTNSTESNTSATAETGNAGEQAGEELPPLNIIDDKYRTTYEIFVYSFYDSDGDGIGDLQGVIDKLDYVNDGNDETDADLGCNEIWLMPISPSPTYHKYDITDYMEIDPEYGTLQDFDNLVKECHDRGVNLIIDLVLNHTSSEHPWFKEATKYLRDHAELTSIYEEASDQEGQLTPIATLQDECPYLYYYNFSKDKQAGFEKVNGSDWYYEARFWSGMPDLNLDNDKVKEEISDITKFWIDRGVDGFRLDAVTSYYTDNDTKNTEFLTWLNDTVKAQKADAYIVGEAWTSIATYSKYYASGIDSFFDFNFSGSEGAIAGVARGKKSPLSFAQAISEAEKTFYENNADYIDAPFYTNHDMARSAGYYVGKGTENMVKMAGALNLLMGGNAFIYYGEELGMKGSGKDENKRAPMQWTTSEESADAKGMCKGPSGMEKITMTYPALDEQMQDEYSVYNYFKKAIRLRNTYPVIARGKTLPIEELSEDGVGAFVRFLADDGNDGLNAVLGKEQNGFEPTALLILINNSAEAKKIDLSRWDGIGDKPQLSYQINVGEEKSALEGMTLTIPSYGIAVIK
nr:alpha-amylase family glycosyl hydrolase [uncultured Butyrivibrio sp.]